MDVLFSRCISLCQLLRICIMSVLCTCLKLKKLIENKEKNIPKWNESKGTTHSTDQSHLMASGDIPKSTFIFKAEICVICNEVEILCHIWWDWPNIKNYWQEVSTCTVSFTMTPLDLLLELSIPTWPGHSKLLLTHILIAAQLALAKQ